MTLAQLAAAAHQREREAGRRQMPWSTYPSGLVRSSTHHAASVAAVLAAWLREQGQEEAAGLIEGVK